MHNHTHLPFTGHSLIVSGRTVLYPPTDELIAIPTESTYEKISAIENPTVTVMTAKFSGS